MVQTGDQYTILVLAWILVHCMKGLGELPVILKDTLCFHPESFTLTGMQVAHANVTTFQKLQSISSWTSVHLICTLHLLHFNLTYYTFESQTLHIQI